MKLLWVVFVAMLFIPSLHAQIVPVCPTSPTIRLLRFPYFQGGGVPVSNAQIELVIGQFVSPTEIWQFKFQNAILSGAVVSGTAPGVRIPVGVPAGNQAGYFGPIPAGDYTIVVQPIATNVTPNVNCPILEIPLTVLQGAGDVPVPGPTGKLAALLAGLLGLMASVALRRKRVRRNHQR